MHIKISLKHAGNITKKVKEYPFLLESTPHTLGELIAEAARTCIAEYRERGEKGRDPSPLTEEEFLGMRELGKFAFGVHYGNEDIDEGAAVENALEAVKDGIVRVFRGNVELRDLDEEITVTEGESFTFVRLTMLSGRMW